MKWLYASLIYAVLLLVISPLSMGKEKALTIQDGRKVSFDYTLTVDDKIMDSSQGKSPLEYTHGEGKIILGLAKQLRGLRAGDKKTITVSPKEAYGAVNPDAFKEVPRSSLPKDLEPKVGMLLQTKNPDGQLFPVTITEVKENTVVMDFNHPLAGKTLLFQVKIVSIN